MTLEFRELSADEAYRLWEEFCEDLGLEHVHQTYGLYWPRHIVEGERVWAFFNDDGQRVGWCAMRPDPVDPMVWEAGGIFSEHRGHGYSKEILLWASRASADIWGVDTMLFVISNHPLLQTYIQYHIRRIFEKRICGEFVAGYISFPPPGYTIFGIKREE